MVKFTFYQLWRREKKKKELFHEYSLNDSDYHQKTSHLVIYIFHHSFDIFWLLLSTFVPFWTKKLTNVTATFHFAHNDTVNESWR